MTQPNTFDGSLKLFESIDIAGTHRRTHSNAIDQIDPVQHDTDWDAVQEQGYVILHDLFSQRELDDIRKAVTPLLGHQGRNPFEGVNTQRVYNVLEKTRACDRVVDHPRVLALLDRLFLPNYLLSQLQVINILPGEAAQGLHHDDSFYPIRRPRPPLGAAIVMAVDPFTADNGATRLIPGSHKWGDDRQPISSDECIPAVMPAGSAIFFLGTLWHGGGANRTENARLALTAQYCEPWLRQQENFSRGVSTEVVNRVSEDIRRMLGYSVHGPFMGMVDGMSPKRTLGDRQD